LYPTIEWVAISRLNAGWTLTFAKPPR